MKYTWQLIIEVNAESEQDARVQIKKLREEATADGWIELGEFINDACSLYIADGDHAISIR